MQELVRCTHGVFPYLRTALQKALQSIAVVTFSIDVHQAAADFGSREVLSDLINFPPVMLSRLLYPVLLQWAVADVQIPTVEIVKGVHMPVMSIGLLIDLCTDNFTSRTAGDH